MPLNKLISLLAEAAVLKLSQEREKKDATPDAMIRAYTKLRRFSAAISMKWVNIMLTFLA